MEKFEVIVVGGGLAGLAAAYTLAEKGVEVLVLERGDYAGAKNVTGGRIYLGPLDGLFAGLWYEAPFERYIDKEEVCLQSPESSLTISYSDEQFKHKHQSFSVLRARLDRWLAKQVERKGGILVTKTRVDDVLLDNGRVIGVKASGDELYADVVIAADGVLSLVAEKAGLRSPGKPADFAVGIKEVIELDAEKIEDRFGLEENEGAACLFLGEATKGIFGGGFLYTNRDSISLGIVAGIEDLGNSQLDITAPLLMEAFKERPEIRKLLRGGETVEYSAHVVPEGGYNALSRLYGDGILVAGDAAGLCINIGITTRGMDYAVASGYYAARTIVQAREKGDYGAGFLKEYEHLLKKSFVLKDLTNFREAPGVLHNPRFYKYYPAFLGDVLRDIYTFSEAPKERLFRTVKKHLSWRDLWQIARDGRKVMDI